MADKAKHVLSRLPVVGYALHWLLDLVKLPIIRQDLVREIEALKAAQLQFEANHNFQQQRHAELVESIAALRRSFGEALSQLDFLCSRIAPAGESESAGAAEARADLRKRLWTMERRLTGLERALSSTSLRADRAELR